MAKPKAQKYLVSGIFYFLLFAGIGSETIGRKDKDDKCGGKRDGRSKVMEDASSDCYQ
jgi:hypothetical protein